MDDLISRQAAIETVRKAKDKSEAHRMLVQLPSAQPVVISKSENATECEDTVSRAVAQRLFGKALTYKEKCGKLGWTTSEVKQWCADFIEDLPSVTPKQPGWIPCSERMPEDGRYLCDYGDCVDFGCVTNGKWYVDGVIAWMPLPTPYREGGQDGTDQN